MGGLIAQTVCLPEEWVECLITGKSEVGCHDTSVASGIACETSISPKYGLAYLLV